MFKPLQCLLVFQTIRILSLIGAGNNVDGLSPKQHLAISMFRNSADTEDEK
jgi:hypothetical protein